MPAGEAVDTSRGLHSARTQLTVAATLAVVAALACGVQVYRVGDSGARAAYGDTPAASSSGRFRRSAELTDVYRAKGLSDNRTPRRGDPCTAYPSRSWPSWSPWPQLAF